MTSMPEVAVSLEMYEPHSGALRYNIWYFYSTVSLIDKGSVVSMFTSWIIYHLTDYSLRVFLVLGI